MASVTSWPQVIPLPLLRQCVLDFDDDAQCASVLKTIEKDAGVESFVSSIQQYRAPRLLVNQVARGRSNDKIAKQGVSTKSEELAMAWKERGNKYYTSKRYGEALVCYNHVRLTISLLFPLFRN